MYTADSGKYDMSNKTDGLLFHKGKYGCVKHGDHASKHSKGIPPALFQDLNEFCKSIRNINYDIKELDNELVIYISGFGLIANSYNFDDVIAYFDVIAKSGFFESYLVETVLAKIITADMMTPPSILGQFRVKAINASNLRKNSLGFKNR